MNKHPFNEIDIDQYILGKAEPSISRQIEEYAHSNPEFKATIENEILIKEGIGRFRIAELKASLSSIPVSISPWYASPAALWTSVAVIVGGAALIVRTSMFDTSEIKPPKATGIPALTDSISEIQIEESMQNIDTQEEGKESQLSNEIQPLKTKQELETPERTPKIAEIPNPTLSNVPQPEEETLISGSEEYETGVGAPSSVVEFAKEGKPSVSRAIHPQYNKHYSYGDDILALYLNGEREPYKVLELKTKTGEKLLYLEYEGKYYSLPPTEGRISDLKILRSLDTIQQLQKLKK